jgi:phage shock protein A
LKEKALNTTALLQQHQDLQAEHQQLRASLESAQAACKAADKDKRKAQDGMAVMKRQLASAQAEASKASAQAAAAQRSVDDAVQTLTGELASLRRLVEQRENRDEQPHAANTSAPAASVTRLAGVPDGAGDRGQSALQSRIADVQQQVVKLAQEVAQLQGREARHAGDTNMADASVVGSLQQQVCAAQ